MSYKAYSNNGLICVSNGYKPPNLHKWGPGVRDLYALHYVMSGKGILETRQSSFHLKTGDSFVIFPHAEVYYYPDPQDPWEYAWIEFKGEEAPRLLSLTELSPDKPVVPEAPRNLAPLFPTVPAADAPPFEIMRAEAKLRLLLSYYMEHYPKGMAARPADYAELAKEYIANNYWKTTVTVSDIASAVRIERSYLFRLFKDATGMSVSAYLAEHRIRRACELLKSTGLTVKSVAYSVGYPDQLHFSRVFKKATSHTPTEYAMLHAARAER